jgi:hypothetical protein
MIKVDEHADYVIVEGKRIERPSRISAGEWLLFWERVKSTSETFSDRVY